MTTSTSDVSLRPSQIVLRHLEEAASQATDKAEIRLPTIRELARQLDVGISTVGSVYKTLAAEGRIRSEVGNGSFLLPQAGRAEARELKVGIGLSKTDLRDPDGWYWRVYNGITMAALVCESPVTIALINLEVPQNEILRQIEKLHAMILLPGRLLNEALIEAAARLEIPAVYFNPPKDDESKNFVSADYSGASELLGRAFRAAGRKNILFLLGESWQLSISAHYRMSGLLTGLHYGESRDVRFHLDVAGGITVEAGANALRRFHQERGEWPDAIYTTGDFLAVGCVEELIAQGLSVPGDVSVIGGSGLDLYRYSQPALTRCAQPYEQIGTEIIDMIRRMRAANSVSVPGKVVRMGWIGGATTLPVENEVLHVGQ